MAALPDLELTCADFNSALDLLRRLGLRLDIIFPADDPHTAILTNGAQRVRLTARPDAPALESQMPRFAPEFVVTRAGAEAGEGRAGMHYRDLIPSRLGGRYIASHIGIADGGPVADWVHYHRIAFQLICVRSGWVRVVYEDQGEPFVMAAADMVLQPPGIRHRVLECSAGLEVVEITCPALHETFADHDMTLPTKTGDAARDFGGQRFLHQVAETSPWTAWHGGEAKATPLSEASGGLADARILKLDRSSTLVVPQHDGELVFGFLLQGSARLACRGDRLLGPADAFVIPPGERWGMHAASEDFQLLHVTTGKFGP